MSSFKQNICIWARGDDFCPNSITSALGLEPSRKLSVGEAINSRKVASKSVWVFSDQEEKSEEEFDIHWQRLFAKIRELESDFVNIASSQNITFVLSIQIEAREQVPGLLFNKKTLKQILSFGFEIDIDVVI